MRAGGTDWLFRSRLGPGGVHWRFVACGRVVRGLGGFLRARAGCYCAPILGFGASLIVFQGRCGRRVRSTDSAQTTWLFAKCYNKTQSVLPCSLLVLACSLRHQNARVDCIQCPRHSCDTLRIAMPLAREIDRAQFDPARAKKRKIRRPRCVKQFCATACSHNFSRSRVHAASNNVKNIEKCNWAA